ncbi:MAG: ABC transporter ATP-binding protein [Elusimicrobia bacterium]|nr:ABC transporter ATP-binding protein [Elusimicrobiota bacterium]
MAIIARSIGKRLGEPPSDILSGVSMEVRDREFLSITGRSGSGKSTLLYLLSSLDTVSSGAVEIDGQDLGAMSPEELCFFRNRQVGFVFQFHYLLSELSAIENVLMPARKAGEEETRRAYAFNLLEEFGLAGKSDRLPRELSGGELQRLAIARSLIMRPKYLFADEPTGSLDTANGELVVGILRRINQRDGTTVLMVTHDSGFAAAADRQIRLADGRLGEADTSVGASANGRTDRSVAPHDRGGSL